MNELAARYGYDRQGNSLSASDDEDLEGYDQRTESEYRSGHYETTADPASQESRTETGSHSGASSGGLGGGAKIPSRPHRNRWDRHRGVSFKEMKRVFAVLVKVTVFCFHDYRQ
jgi:hypothetical protein